MGSDQTPHPPVEQRSYVRQGRVIEFACGLFDHLAPLHGLRRSDRELLSRACWIRGVTTDPHALAGDGVDVAEPLSDLDERDVAVVEAVNHYASDLLPHVGHGIWRRLDASERHRVAWLVGLLRMAEGLAEELPAPKRADIYATWTDSLLHIEVDGDHVFGEQVGAVNRKSAALEYVTGRRLLLTSSYRRLGMTYPGRQIAH